jgi:RNA polymerase sigma-70 factor (ECF subfamily)
MNTALEQDRRRKTDDGNKEGLAKQDTNVATELSDDAIIERIRNGDVNAFELLMRRYKQWVFGIVSKHMAHNQVAETAQDVFIQAYRSLPHYRMNTSFKQWLALIAGRCCCHYWRAVNRYSTCAISNLNAQDTEQLETVREEAACAAFHTETDYSAKCDSVRTAMDGLGANDRRILELLYMQDYSLPETAAMLGYTLVNARVRACRARNALRTLLKPAVVTEKSLVLVNPAIPSSPVDQNLSSAETQPMPAWLITTGLAALQHNYA